MGQWGRKTNRHPKHGVCYWLLQLKSKMTNLTWTWGWKLFWEKQGHHSTNKYREDWTTQMEKNCVQECFSFLKKERKLNLKYEGFTEPTFLEANLDPYCITTPPYPYSKHSSNFIPSYIETKNNNLRANLESLHLCFLSVLQGKYCCNFTLSLIQQFCWVLH